MMENRPESSKESGTGHRRAYGVLDVVSAFVTSIMLMRRFKVVVPLLIYLALKLLVIAWYLGSTSEPWTSFWAIFIRDIDGATLGHYPLHLLSMLKILERFDIILHLCIRIVFLGATVHLVSAAYRRRTTSLRAGFSAALRSYPNLVIVAVISSALLLAAANVPGMMERISAGFPAMAMTALAGLLGLAVQAFFVYAVPSVMIGNRTAIRAMGKSFATARRSFLRTCIIVAVPLVLTAPIVLLELKADAIAMRTSPETLIYIRVAGDVLHVASAYLLTACATIVYIWRNA